MRTKLRLPCSLFVPRVKESRLCTVCGYTLLDHNVETPIYANNGYHTYKDHQRDEVYHTNGYINGHAVAEHFRYNRPHTVSPPRLIETQFTPSKNSAFSEYKRINSKDSIPISSISTSPVSFKASPYSHIEHRRSMYEPLAMGNGHQILKPKPMPMQRSYLKNSNAPSPLNEESETPKDHSNTPSSQMFKKIKQKRSKERSSSIGDNIGLLSPDYNSNSLKKQNDASKSNEAIVRPHNFKDILNKFQSAADVNSTFQRHHSVRLPRRTTIERNFGTPNSVDLKRASSTVQTIPIPSPRRKNFEKASKNDYYQEESDLSETEEHTTIKTDQSSPYTVSQALKESNAIYESAKTTNNNTPSDANLTVDKSDSRASSNNISPYTDDRYGQQGVVLSPTRLSNDELSSPEEEIVTVNNQKPMNLKKQFEGMRKSRPVYNSFDDSMLWTWTPLARSHSTATRRSSSSAPFTNALVPLRIFQNEPKKRDSIIEKAESSQALNARTVMAVDYVSGSDSGCPRWSHGGSAETSSLESPRSPLLRSPNPQRLKAFDDIYNQMTLGHTNSLAFLADNFAEISKLHIDHSELGRETYKNVSLSSIIFKSPSPLFIKEKIALFEANFLANNYEGFPVTIMMAPTCHYAPLMGRHAERSGFGPLILTEFEESEFNVRHLVDISFDQRNNIRVVVMPPMSVCSFHTLAAHNMHQGMDVNRYDHHVCFIMLQLLSALKYLQSDGVEHMSNNFKEFLLTYKDTNLKIALQELHSLPKLLLLKETMEEDFDEHSSAHSFHEGGRVGLCRYALRALCTLLNHKMYNTVPDIQERTEYSWPLKRCAQLLHMNKSSSLTEAKNLLEFAFFVGDNTRFDNEYDAKLWLDEKRATLVNRMIKLLVEKSEDLSDNKERMYVQFLLSSTPRTLFNTFKALHKR